MKAKKSSSKIYFDEGLKAKPSTLGQLLGVNSFMNIACTQEAATKARHYFEADLCTTCGLLIQILGYW